VTIDVHGSLDRAKDVSSHEEARIRRHLDECMRLTHATTFPSSFFQRTPAVIGASACQGTSPLQTSRTDRDEHCFRKPAKVDGILRIRVPSTVTPRARERIASPDTRVGSPLTPPTPCSHGWGQCALRALQVSPQELPRKDFGEQDTSSTSLMILANPRLGLTTQASQRSSVCAAFRVS